MNEKHYINRVLKGDTSAFSYFVDTYQDMAITIAYRICGNKADAEDIVQNAYVRAFHNLHTFRSDSKFSTWFYRIVYNTAVTFIKSAVFNTEFVDHKVVDNSYSDFDTLDQIEEQEKKELIKRTMSKMSPDEGLLLTLFYLEDNSIKDIGLITGLSEANVKVKLHRARKRFGETMIQLM